LKADSGFDLVMPGMTGTELAKSIRQHWPGMPGLLVSGFAVLPNGEGPDVPRLGKPYRREERAALLVRDLVGVATMPKNVVRFAMARPK
jgi:CheY-like chemotaxis protein